MAHSHPPRASDSVAQMVSAPPCHGGGRGFKSRQGRSGCCIALLGSRRVARLGPGRQNAVVVSPDNRPPKPASPPPPRSRTGRRRTLDAPHPALMAQRIAHLTTDQGVVGSNPAEGTIRHGRLRISPLADRNRGVSRNQPSAHRGWFSARRCRGSPRERTARHRPGSVTPPSSRGPGYRPFTSITPVRIRLGVRTTRDPGAREETWACLPGGIGRRGALKRRCPSGRGGSNPSGGTVEPAETLTPLGRPSRLR